MSELAAQVSLYPLGQEELSPAIDEVLRVFETHGLQVAPGPMSTVLSGDDAALFAALHEATRAAAGLGKMVMVITVSNACAVPEA
ncbi:MAG: YkoF family thiamine/hydroxymethylpyrimidine-binding protein [Dehalococcoidia bacterium]